MNTERDSHPLAGKRIIIHPAPCENKKLALPEGAEFDVEDWWDRLTGKSWMFSDGNPAAMIYAMRNGFSGLPTDNEVVYGHIGAFGHLVHESELGEEA